MISAASTVRSATPRFYVLHALADAARVFEAVSEDAPTERALFALIDRMRNARTIVATGSSGPGRTIVLLERARLPVPRAVVDAAAHQRALFNEPRVDSARFFVVAA